MTPLDKVIERLDAKGCNAKRGAAGWQAQCPSHADKAPSLSVSETELGKVLLYCFAGCSTQDVMSALDLTFSDLFARDGRTVPSDADGKTFKADYHYRSADGTMLYRVRKYAYPNGQKTFRQQAFLDGNFQHTMGAVERVLYQLPQVVRGIAQGKPVWIVEGEKDAENLSMHAGIVATCNPGGADNGTGNKFTQAMVSALDKATEIVVCIDNDPPGEQHGRGVYRRLMRDGRTLSIVRPTIGKDISEHLAGGGTVATLELLDSSESPTGWVDESPLLLEEPENPNGWWPIDATAYLDGSYTPIVPTVLTRSDGQGLFYIAKVNSLFGESGSGKSWVLLHALAQQITLGHDVAYIDYEDSPGSVIERLVLLGLTPSEVQERFHYVKPWGDITEPEMERLCEFLISRHCTAIGIDSAGEALAMASRNPNADEEVATWYRQVPRRLAQTGAAVILVDHIAKSSEGRPTAIGSQRKKAAIDGASYAVHTEVPFSRGHLGEPGLLRISCSKDRHGQFANGATAALASISTQQGVHIVLTDARNPIAKTVQKVDMKLEERATSWIEAQTEAWTLADFNNAVGGDTSERFTIRTQKVNHLWRATGEKRGLEGLYITIRPEEMFASPVEATKFTG